MGKTTFLLHHAKDRTILYYSSDNPLFAGKSLYDTVCPGSVEQGIKFVDGHIWAGRIAALMVY